MIFDVQSDNFDGAERPLGEKRFPDGAWGVYSWRETLYNLDRIAALDEPVVVGRDPTRRLFRPRVFVSHQRREAKAARRVAWLATRFGFSFWLDVLDPDLRKLHGRSLDSKRRAILMATIIETALMNCTHVVALLTKRSERSRWIPYEYGRVKERAVNTRLALAWVEPGYTGKLPEYLLLGDRTGGEAGLRQWFWEQRQWFLQKRGLPKLARRKKRAWTGPAPMKLPC